MRRRKQELIGIALAVVGTSTIIATLVARPGLATPPVGSTTVMIASGQQVVDSEKIKSREGTDVVVVQNTFVPGGSSGWHSHPGVAVIVVQSGAITLYRERIGGGECRTHTYTAGQTFLEFPKNMQNGVNQGSVNAVVAVTFFQVPHLGLARIDQPDPGDCPD